ncbi:peptidoglycan bridge formation glycyltransferase FemA/FemB family protein [Patescibacteria group bacterium]|nr:peptidoglycan bridge formation glycyltransferase FemA/FemB family protein [Patescibacteria group bacterium]MBU1890603.1 peptidoglycan bridge formation glycyltransferase FemA/FemB family protein [Patescibacteria group bacterium]
MKLVLCPSKNILTDFLLAQHPSQFLQSHDWGEFQKSLGRKVYHFLVIDEEVSPADDPTPESIMASLSVVVMPLRKKRTYYYAPRGPVVYLETPVPDQSDMWRTIVADLKSNYMKKDNAIFLRMEPGIEQVERTDLRSILTSDYPVEYLKKSVQPSTTLHLDLSPEPEDILKAMHQKTRYNVRLAEKKGIRITTGWEKKDVEDFWKLLEATSTRDTFTTHSKEYYEKMVEVFGGEWDTRSACRVKLYRAEHEGKTLAINLMMSFGDTVTYLHGASSNEGRNMMAPHLLQWQAIKDARSSGAKVYDFWGVAPTDNKKHPWAGFTRFKKGFGGKIIYYWGTFDVVFRSFWYIAYSLLKKH